MKLSSLGFRYGFPKAVARIRFRGTSRFAWKSTSRPIVFFATFWLACTLALPNADSNAAEINVPSEPDAAPSIEFLELPTSAIREGYLTLTWTELSQAAGYELMSGSKILYRGRLPKGFISGLEDGQHEIHVIAWNQAGEMVGQSNVVVVDVDHWPLSMALGLFAVGVVVMSSLFLTLIVGTIRTRTAYPRSKSVAEQASNANRNEGIT